jgi:spore maturation protein SpmA
MFLSAPADKGGVVGWSVHSQRLLCAACVVFLSGNRTPAEFRDGNGRHLQASRTFLISLILNKLPLSLLLATVVQYKSSQEAAMIHRTFFLHYRLVREAVTAVVTIGMALLFSYLILWARL